MSTTCNKNKSYTIARTTSCYQVKSMAGKQSFEEYQVGDDVYAGRPPLFNCVVDDIQYRGKIVCILPAIRRKPISFEISFDQPDRRTGENGNVVVPSVNRRGRCLIFKCTRDSGSSLIQTNAPAPQPEVPMIVVDSEEVAEATGGVDLALDPSGDVYTIVDFPVHKTVSAIVFSPVASKKLADNTPAPTKKKTQEE